MRWNDLLCPKRARMNPYQNSTGNSDLRSEFEKDYHRIIGSSAFRRLQDKTQVFPLDQSDFIRTRLTHSMEVSSFAKSLGQNIAQYILRNNLDPDFTLQTQTDICDILLCAGLIHDIGNPPFGHFGEEAIRAWFVKNLHNYTYIGQPVTEILNEQMLQDLYNFEGNAQALRLVSKLHYLVDENGMNLTYGLLNTIVKYPVSSVGIDKSSGDIKSKKMGYFLAEEELFKDVVAHTTAVNCRHPLTYILEAADDIAYRTADIEDSFKKGRISYQDLLLELDKYQKKAKVNDSIDALDILKHQYNNALKREAKNPELYAIQNWVVRIQSRLIFCATYGFTYHYRQIMSGEYKEDILAGTKGEWLMEALGDMAVRYTFLSKPILKLELTAGNIFNFIMDILVPAAIHYDSREPMDMMEKKAIALLSENHKQIYHICAREQSEEKRLYLRLLLVTDFVSGMTDSYAKNLYQELQGIL